MSTQQLIIFFLLTIINLCVFLPPQIKLLRAENLSVEEVNSALLSRYQKRYPDIIGPQFKIKILEDATLSKVFPEVDFYEVTLFIDLPPAKEVVFNKQKEVFFFPLEFNRLINEEAKSFDDQRILDVAFAFCKLSDPPAIPYIELSDQKIEHINEAMTTVCFSTYSKLGGIREKWEINLLYNQISKGLETIVGKNEGDFMDTPFYDYDKSFRSLNYPKYYLPKVY